MDSWVGWLVFGAGFVAFLGFCIGAGTIIEGYVDSSAEDATGTVILAAVGGAVLSGMVLTVLYLTDDQAERGQIGILLGLGVLIVLGSSLYLALK